MSSREFREALAKSSFGTEDVREASGQITEEQRQRILDKVAAKRSEQVNVTVSIDPDEIREWAERHADAGNHSVAHVLFAAHDLYAGMQEEWGVEDRWGHVTWFPLTDYIAGASDESRRMAEEYAAGDDDYYLVRRHVTGVIADE